MTTTSSILIQNVAPDELAASIRSIIKEELALLGPTKTALRYVQQDPLFTIEQFCDYLPEKIARQTVYGWVNDRKVPFEKFGKRLYFRKSDIDTWLANGRQMTNQD